MRMKCQPVKLKKSQPCRLCGRPVTDGYILKCPVGGCSCRDCYERFYGPIAARTAFHMTDIFTGSFWRPFHIEEGVVMFPALSASVMRGLNGYMRRGLPILLIILLVVSGTGISALGHIPGHILHILSQLLLLLQASAGLIVTAAGHLPGIFAHLVDGGVLILSSVAHMPGQMLEWIRGLI